MSRAIGKVLTALLFTLMLSPLSAAHADETAVISGQIVDLKGKPIAGVELTIAGPNSQEIVITTVSTDASGNWSIKAYKIENQFKSTGIIKVISPRLIALKDMTTAVFRRFCGSGCKELIHILPASATNVMPIIRIDQISGSELAVRSSKSRNIFGDAINKIALTAKTVDPVLRIFRTRNIPFWDSRDF